MYKFDNLVNRNIMNNKDKDELQCKIAMLYTKFPPNTVNPLPGLNIAGGLS